MDRHTRTRYTTEEVVQHVLEPGSDSEVSDLEDSDDDFDELNMNEVEAPIIEVSNLESSDDDGSEDEETTVLKWKKKEPVIPNVSFTGKDFTLPQDVDKMTPLSYFKTFWDDSITKNLVEQTNLYSVQMHGKNITTTSQQIEQFIGMQMLMGIVRMPNYVSYWANGLRYEPIASVMPLKCYQNLRKFLHVNDNSKKDEPMNKDNRLYKIQPVLDTVRQNCLLVEPEINHSIDEQIIPAKTRYSGIRQYNPKKPTKWGFKNFVRAGKSGMMYDFFLYAGAKSAGKEKCTCQAVVLRLCENLPRNSNHRLFFDNWFSTFNLCLELKALGILTIATLRKNRLGGCSLMSEKDLKKAGRGSFDYRTDEKSGLHVIRWQDNKCVQIVSTFAGVKASKTVKRWDGKRKEHILVPCPDMVRLYNESMGGVDLADMLIALYRTKIKTRRWYLKVLFHCIDIAKVNAWILYRRHCDQRAIPRKKQMSLLQFSLEISHGLMKVGKSSQKRSLGRPSNAKNSGERCEKRGRKPVAALPTRDVRHDNIHHWPEHSEKKSRCRLCKTGYSRIYCDKCNVHLCLNKTNNCFKDFHTK